MITVAGLDIDGSEVDLSASSTVKIVSNPWLYRNDILTSKSPSGDMPIEVETITGKRVIVQNNLGIYHDIPINNDTIVLSGQLDQVYAAINVNITATAVSIVNINKLIDANRASLAYYSAKSRLLTRIADTTLSYANRIVYLNDLNVLSGSGLIVTIPGITGDSWEFLESGGLNISIWPNGPYADIKIGLTATTQFIL